MIKSPISQKNKNTPGLNCRPRTVASLKSQNRLSSPETPLVDRKLRADSIEASALQWLHTLKLSSIDLDWVSLVDGQLAKFLRVAVAATGKSPRCELFRVFERSFGRWDTTKINVIEIIRAMTEWILKLGKSSDCRETNSSVTQIASCRSILGLFVSSLTGKSKNRTSQEIFALCIVCLLAILDVDDSPLSDFGITFVASVVNLGRMVTLECPKAGGAVDRSGVERLVKASLELPIQLASDLHRFIVLPAALSISVDFVEELLGRVDLGQLSWSRSIWMFVLQNLGLDKFPNFVKILSSHRWDVQLVDYLVCIPHELVSQKNSQLNGLLNLLQQGPEVRFLLGLSRLKQKIDRPLEIFVRSLTQSHPVGQAALIFKEAAQSLKSQQSVSPTSMSQTEKSKNNFLLQISFHRLLIYLTREIIQEDSSDWVSLFVGLPPPRQFPSIEIRAICLSWCQSVSRELSFGPNFLDDMHTDDYCNSRPLPPFVSAVVIKSLANQKLNVPSKLNFLPLIDEDTSRLGLVALASLLGTFSTVDDSHPTLPVKLLSHLDSDAQMELDFDFAVAVGSLLWREICNDESLLIEWDTIHRDTYRSFLLRAFRLALIRLESFSLTSGWLSCLLSIINKINSENFPLIDDISHMLARLIRLLTLRITLVLTVPNQNASCPNGQINAIKENVEILKYFCELVQSNEFSKNILVLNELILEIVLYCLPSSGQSNSVVSWIFKLRPTLPPPLPAVTDVEIFTNKKSQSRRRDLFCRVLDILLEAAIGWAPIESTSFVISRILGAAGLFPSSDRAVLSRRIAAVVVRLVIKKFCKFPNKVLDQVGSPLLTSLSIATVAWDSPPKIKSNADNAAGTSSDQFLDLLQVRRDVAVDLSQSCGSLCEFGSRRLESSEPSSGPPVWILQIAKFVGDSTVENLRREARDIAVDIKKCKNGGPLKHQTTRQLANSLRLLAAASSRLSQRLEARQESATTVDNGTPKGLGRVMNSLKSPIAKKRKISPKLISIDVRQMTNENSSEPPIMLGREFGTGKTKSEDSEDDEFGWITTEMCDVGILAPEKWDNEKSVRQIYEDANCCEAWSNFIRSGFCSNK